MNESDCEMLEVLYEEKNINRTAIRLFLTQPAVTYRIQKLEKRFGVSILTRGSKGVLFTPQGKLLVSRARKILNEIRITVKMLGELDNENWGTLRIGVVNNFSLYILPKIVENFRNKYPNIKINIKTGLGEEIMEYLSKDEIHLAVESGNYRWEGHKTLFRKDSLVIIAKQPMELEELAHFPMVIYKTNTEIQKLHNDWWFSHFTTQPNILMEVDFVEICKRMVKEGLGFAIVPKYCLNENGTLWIKELKDKRNDPITINTWLNYRKSVTNLSFVNKFIDFFIREQNKIKY